MPTYRYRCSGCGEEFELWQSINDESLRTHEDGCGGEVLKVLTPAGIVLKGAGFYRNDSRSSDGKRKSSDGSKPKDTKETKDSKESTDGGGSSESAPSSSESGTDSKGGDSTSSTTSPGESKSTAGAAKPS